MSLLIENYVQKTIDIAIRMQAAETQGDSLSPIRASFQNVPRALKWKVNYQCGD